MRTGESEAHFFDRFFVLVQLSGNFRSAVMASRPVLAHRVDDEVVAWTTHSV
jgi:hypothetical protein